MTEAFMRLHKYQSRARDRTEPRIRSLGSLLEAEEYAQVCIPSVSLNYFALL
jgi:hypothetical protein